MQIFEIETGIPVPKRRRKPACPYPFANMQPGQSFFVAERPEHCSKLRRHSTSAYLRWKMREGLGQLGHCSASVEEDGVSGVRFWMVDKGVVNDGQK